jgi:hypothetical protein
MEAQGALQRADDDAYDLPDKFSGVLFPMTDGKSRIVYKVTYAALQDRASADGSGATFDPVETFLKYRRSIEQIASEKYDAGVTDRVVTTAELTPLPPHFEGALSAEANTRRRRSAATTRRRRSAAAISSGATEVPLPPRSNTEPGTEDQPAAPRDVVPLEARSLPDTPSPQVPDQTRFAPVRIEERGGKIARASDRDSALRSSEADFNAWRQPIIEHVRELLKGDFQQGTNHGRARDRLVALDSLLSGNLSEVKERQFRIGYEIERLDGLVSTYKSASDDMPELNAAVLEDLDRLRVALKIGIDKLDRWAEFRRMAADDPQREGDADPTTVSEALDDMAVVMEQQPKYFDPDLPNSFGLRSQSGTQ